MAAYAHDRKKNWKKNEKNENSNRIIDHWTSIRPDMVRYLTLSLSYGYGHLSNMQRENH